MTVKPPISSGLIPETLSEGDTLGEHVGVLLRRTRETGRIALAEVAAALRIRVYYLQAIEQGMYENLPAPVYAVGFVRAYAEYLGLDGEEAVRRFKRDAHGLDSQPDLAFPLPIAERSIPGGRILVTALVLAICGYGLWYYEAGGGRPQPETVADVPPALLHPAQSVNTGPAAEPAASPVEAHASVPAPPQSVAAPSPRIGKDTKVAAAPVVAPPPPVPAPRPQPGLRTAATPLQPAAPAVEEPTQPDSSVTAAAPEPVSPAAPEMLAALELPEPPPPKPSVPGRVYGATDEPSRISLRFTGDCWIEIKDADQELRVSKLYHAGEVFRVADLPGLTLALGSADRVKILVDGKPVPVPKGPSPLRDIALDPDVLTGGHPAATPDAAPAPPPIAPSPPVR
jgi:cytoskeleton protein RodZ